MSWIIKLYKILRRFIKRASVKYYRQMSKHRVSWSLIKLVESFSKLQLASAALTYHTVFAIVPIMSLMIAIAKGLGYDDLLVMQIQSMFEGQEIISNSLLMYANSYLSNTKVTMWLGVGIGLLLLLYSVFSIFSTIDATFNMLWNERGRSFGKLIKTFAIVLVMPFIVVLALVLWWSVSSIFSDSIVKELNVLIVSVSTYVLILFAAYKYIPKTKVKAKYAALSACVCGSIFALMQYFSYHIISSFNYRNIYGDLASLMIFLLLIYFSWTVCLAGSKWNFFLQKAEEQERKDDYKSINHRYQKFLSLLVLERIESLHPFSGHFNAEALAVNTEKEYGLPIYLTIDILRYLREKKIIFKGKNESLHLSKRYSGRTVGQMLDDLDTAGRNSDAMAILGDVHSNVSFAHLWKVVNEEKNEYSDEILITPVSEILGIKNICK